MFGQDWLMGEGRLEDCRVLEARLNGRRKTGTHYVMRCTVLNNTAKTERPVVSKSQTRTS
jgi:hypothetical protein